MAGYRIQRVGGQFSDRDAEIIASELFRLMQEHAGVTPHQIVDAAMPEDAPLHRYFQWDDAAAAYEYRLSQAREMTRSVQVRVVREDVPEAKPQWTRAFVSVTTRQTEPEIKAERRYVPLQEAQARPEYGEQITAQAFRELAQWRQRYEQYAHLPQLRVIADHIDELLGGQAAD